MSCFVDLPVEVHIQIRAYVNHPRDWVHYALSSQRLWQRLGGDELIRHAAKVDHELHQNSGVLLTTFYGSLLTRAIHQCPSLQQTLRVVDIWREVFPDVVRGSWGMTRHQPLCAAARTGRIGLIDALIARGCPIDDMCHDRSYCHMRGAGMTAQWLVCNPLVEAVRAGHEGAAVRLLEHGAAVSPETLCLAAAWRMPWLLREAIRRVQTLTFDLPSVLRNALRAASVKYFEGARRTPSSRRQPQGRVRTTDRNDAVIDVLLSAGADSRGLLHQAVRNRCIWNMVKLFYHSSQNRRLDGEDWVCAMRCMSKRQLAQCAVALQDCHVNLRVLDAY